MKLIAVTLFMISLASVSIAQKKATMNITLFYHNDKFDPELDNCNKVYPTVRKIPRTTAVARAALDELFKGVTAEERSKGFWSFDPDATRGVIKSLNVKNGAAYLNFTKRAFETLGNATTSCGSGFFATIEETLTQFPTIKKVYYAVEGNANDFYEWVQVGECPYGRHCRKANFK